MNSTSKLFLVFALTLFSVNSFAEAEAKARLMKEYGISDQRKAQIEEQKEAPSVSSDEAQNNQDALEAQIKNTVKDLQGMAGGVGGSETSAADLENMDFESLPAGKAASGDGKIQDSYLSGMMNEMMTKMISSFLKENPFSKMDKEEVKSMLVVRTQGLPVGKMFENNPKLVEMLVDWIRHPYALPKIMGIINKPDKVKIYSGIVVAIFILSFLLNLANSKGNLFKRILKKICIFAGAFTINIAAFIFLFQANLKPTFEVIFKHFHF
jgi:hypothetical protein